MTGTITITSDVIPILAAVAAVAFGGALSWMVWVTRSLMFIREKLATLTKLTP